MHGTNGLDEGQKINGGEMAPKREVLDQDSTGARGRHNGEHPGGKRTEACQVPFAGAWKAMQFHSGRRFDPPQISAYGDHHNPEAAGQSR
jgi:hypothetical protein